MSNSATTALHDRWRRALDGEDFKPSNAESKVDSGVELPALSHTIPPVDTNRLFYNQRRKSMLSITLRGKMIRNGKSSNTIAQDELIDEAGLLVKLFKTCGEMSAMLQTPVPMFRSKRVYDWDRLMMALIAVSDRLTMTDQHVRVLQYLNRGTNNPAKTNLPDPPQSITNNRTEDSRKEINELIEAHRAEIAVLIQEKAKDKDNFSTLSLTFSRLLHEMVVHVRTAQKEKTALTAFYEAEILELHNQLSQQRTLIDAMLNFIAHLNSAITNKGILGSYTANQTTESVSLGARLEQVITECETMPSLQDKDVTTSDLKQEMKQKEQDWEAERQEYKEKIAKLEAKLEKMQTWEEEGTQWDSVTKKSLKIKNKDSKADS